MNLADKTLDALVSREFVVSRFEADIRRRTLHELQELRVTHRIRLAQDITERRLPSFLAAVEVDVSAAYARVEKIHSREYLLLMKDELRFQREAINRSVNADILKRWHGKIVHERNKLLIEGALLKEVWSRQAKAYISTVWDEARRAVRDRAPVSELLTRVVGTRSRRFRDGAIAKFHRSAVTLGITGINRAMNDARMLLYRANSDVIRGLQAVAVLDAKTSDICRARAGAFWNMETGAALPNSVVRSQFPGPPPWHYRCRTILLPVIRKRSELAKVNQRVRARVLGKAGFDGRPAADLRFDDWLSRRTATEQREILGPGKFDLWNKGLIRIPDLIDQAGRPLTLEQLRQKRPVAA